MRKSIQENVHIMLQESAVLTVLCISRQGVSVSVCKITTFYVLMRSFATKS